MKKTKEKKYKKTNKEVGYKYRNGSCSPGSNQGSMVCRKEYIPGVT